MADKDKKKKQPPKDAPKKTRDCYDTCAATYDACMKAAGSQAEQAACGLAYDKCVSNC